ncbi:unnamed protein product [Anisakis simplex]|uniref:Nanchung (inferred by orthology to a D. melanogaster protein) n=1 Tax=Anisakis simplex TaxID=6269 RepID=A0A0M3JY62_ANISI|nr:unnamed protein product [Anisakis simplex]
MDRLDTVQPKEEWTSDGDMTAEKRARADTTVKNNPVYRLTDTMGGGLLIPFIRYAIATGDESLIDEVIAKEVKPLMYRGGHGKLAPISELILIRNRQRNALLSALYRRKGKGKQGPNVLEAVDQEYTNPANVRKVLKLLDGGGNDEKDRYREIVWSLKERGAMGETLLGACLLNGTRQHNSLARKLIKMFPKLVNDICVSEECYGLSPLHQAIMNEDPEMVYFLLQNGADVHARSVGALFCPDDQKSTRTDSLEHEWVEMDLETDYNGKMYFGEYPLSYAICANQMDSFRLLIAKGADPNLKDTNGNTALHLAMFEEVLKLEADVRWSHYGVAVISYPLENIDTINQRDGELNEDSALSMVVYNEKREHLDLFDGLMEDLLTAKWKAFARGRLVISFIAFFTYFVAVFIVFMCRSSTRFVKDGTSALTIPDGDQEEFNMTNNVEITASILHECQISWYYTSHENSTEQLVSSSFVIFTEPIWSESIRIESKPLDKTLILIIAEVYILIATIYQILDDFQDLRNCGRRRMWKVLKAFPAKIAYKCSFFFVLAIVPIRLCCTLGKVALLLDDILSVIIVLCVAVHFLFFLRAVKFVGPFVLMIYNIVTRDISRFLLIYAIFVLGFSQACDRERAYSNGTNTTEVLKHPVHYIKGTSSNFDMSSPCEAAIRLFMTTLGEYTVLYRHLHHCPYSFMRTVGKLLFIIYQLLVSLLMINLLIAMLTRTFNQIAQTQQEWKRQVARVILMVELSMKPEDRLHALIQYSRPMQDDKTRRAFIVTKKIEVQNLSAREKQERAEKLKSVKDARHRSLRRRLKVLFAHESLHNIPDHFRGSARDFQHLYEHSEYSAQF